MNHEIFHELFVLELANNHRGNLDRGLRIIAEFSQVVRFNNVRAAIKFQFRDVDGIIHKNFRNRSDIPYIKKTLETKMSRQQYRRMVEAAREAGCLVSSTPFDEVSVDLCEELEIDFIKIASSDMNDWFLIEKIAKTRKPVSISTGGSSLKDIDDLVKFFGNRKIPIALNHCVSIYPSEDHELEMNQIDFLRNRYPDVVIGCSTHEYHSWHISMHIAYGKGARTFERHIDIDSDGVVVAPYCSLPHQIDAWFKAFRKSKEMCGGSIRERRFIPEKEVEYLNAMVRGVYARRDLPAGYVLHHKGMDENFYLAIPLQKGQLSCREIMNGERLLHAIKKDEPLMVNLIEGPYSASPDLYKLIYSRGI